jgi:hypothetical protein
VKHLDIDSSYVIDSLAFKHVLIFYSVSLMTVNCILTLLDTAFVLQSLAQTLLCLQSVKNYKPVLPLKMDCSLDIIMLRRITGIHTCAARELAPRNCPFKTGGIRLRLAGCKRQGSLQLGHSA